MTDETLLILERISAAKQATVDDMVFWTGRTRAQAGVTIGLMIEAGQLKHAGKDFMGKRLYRAGTVSTFGLGAS